jgi:hypothetical protein
MLNSHRPLLIRSLAIATLAASYPNLQQLAASFDGVG